MTVSTEAERSASPSFFGPLPVSPPIARALTAMGYEIPTPIQEQAIPPLREGRDVMGQAQTGTGKTAGFGIPLIEALDSRLRVVQAIILVPTRELCLQVAEELARLGDASGLRVLAVYGGVGFGRQLEELRRGVQIIVGTPGRVEDLLQRGVLRLRDVRVAVLDEADRMLDVGFLPPIERILGQTPKSRQTALFSATIPDEIYGLAHRQMRDPIVIKVTPERPTVDAIEQRFQRVGDGDKLRALQAHLDDPACFLALVFRRTTFKADRLARDLSRMGYKVAVLHGRRSQSQRERVLADLKSCKLQVLVATDIAARGLDITGLTHVFNYDLPDTAETYIHRIGRTGRAGETGIAITLVAPEDEDGLRAIERYLAGQRGSAIRMPSQRQSSKQPRSNPPRRGDAPQGPRERFSSRQDRRPAPASKRDDDRNRNDHAAGDSSPNPRRRRYTPGLAS